MDNKDLLQIKISKVINAPRWKVMRQLTKVWEYPDFVPTIKEASIIEKNRNVIKTQWHIIVDEQPINWIEEDTIVLGENTIHFKAIEGDLKEFHGSWHFSDHPEGTKVNVTAYIKVGMPAIASFAEEYMRGIVHKNFEHILDFVEQRLVSCRYKSLKEGDASKVAGFGLIGHFYNLGHLAKGLKMIDPNYDVPSTEFLAKLFDAAPSLKMFEMKDYASKDKKSKTDGCVILCSFVPDMISNNMQRVYEKVVRACKLAEKHGVGVVTLGGFTSIVAERFGREIRDEVDIPVTTGNTLAAALAVEGVERAAELLGKDISQLKVAIIGGTGDVGSACARSLTEKAAQVTITGRTMINLYKFQHELKSKKQARIAALRNNEKAVKNADIVIAAANSSASILRLEWFKPGAIVCDLAYPKNISYKSTREDLFVFSGGLASVPEPVDASVMMGLPSPSICYGCSCEAIVLALERRYESYSFGRCQIKPDKMKEILDMAKKHGFDLAPFFWADQTIGEEQIAKIKEAEKAWMASQ